MGHKSMKIHIKLIGVFRSGRFKEQSRDYPVGTKVQIVVKDLMLPQKHLGIVLINGVHARVDSLLQDGDTLSLLPVLGGG